jgi:DnaJ family protein C protein 1
MDDVKKRLEKKQKKKKTDAKLDQIDSSLQKFYDSLESPTFKQTLPYRFAMWLFYLAINMPAISKSIWAHVTKKKEMNPVEEEDSEEEYERQQAEIEERRRQRAQKNLQDLNPKKIEKSDLTAAVNYLAEKKPDESSNKTSSSTKSKEWADKEKAELIKAIVKFPAGTANRWVKIGEVLERTANECLNMEKSIKSNLTSTMHAQMNASTWTSGQMNPHVTDAPTMSDKFQHTNGDANKPEPAAEKCVWSQEHQKLFEKALKEIGKDVPNRWDKIAESVPGKTKVIQNFNI